MKIKIHTGKIAKISTRTRKTAAGTSKFVTLASDTASYEELVQYARATYSGMVVTSGGVGTITIRLPAEPKFKYPTELIARAEYEMKVFERCAADTCADLIAEIKRLRARIRNDAAFC